MTNKGLSRNGFFTANLAQDELEYILRRIDENLALRPLFRQRVDDAMAVTPPNTPPVLPDLGDLSWHVQELHHMQAPLFVIKGRDMRNQLKRLLNLPIRIFGHKQVRFNRELLEVVGLISAQLEGLHWQAAYIVELNHTIEQLQEQMQQQQVILQSLAERQNIQPNASPLEAINQHQPTNYPTA